MNIEKKCTNIRTRKKCFTTVLSFKCWIGCKGLYTCVTVLTWIKDRCKISIDNVNYTNIIMYLVKMVLFILNNISILRNLYYVLRDYIGFLGICKQFKIFDYGIWTSKTGLNHFYMCCSKAVHYIHFGLRSYKTPVDIDVDKVTLKLKYFYFFRIF